MRIAARSAALRRESEHLERQHREHTGHQVQQQPADKSERECETERQGTRIVDARWPRQQGLGDRRGAVTGNDGADQRRVDQCRARTVGVCGELPEAAVIEYAGHASEFADALVRDWQREFPLLSVACQRLHAARLDLALVVREETATAKVCGAGSRRSGVSVSSTVESASGRAHFPAGERTRQRVARLAIARPHRESGSPPPVRRQPAR